jgi:hypothetical protein
MPSHSWDGLALTRKRDRLWDAAENVLLAHRSQDGRAEQQATQRDRMTKGDREPRVAGLNQ